MYIYLTEENKDRLRSLAQKMGVIVPYHFSYNYNQSTYIMSSDGSLTAIIPDSWLVDMFEEIDTRIEKLEEKVGLL
jgi:hypothetical protein